MIYFAITTNILYMRKVLLSIALLTTAIYTVAQQRTEAEAAAIAKTFMQENGYNFDITKSTAPAKIRAKKAGEITPYYIFNDTRKGGFVIVGGQEGMSDILAYSDEECFDINDIPPTAANWLEAYTQCAIIAADEPEKSKACKREAAKAFAKSNFSLRQNVTPLLGEIKYNQMEPYNRKCPTLTVMEGGNKKTGTAITGCTQTAMAMIMRYWKWPERPTGSKSYTLNYYYSGSTTKQMNLSVNFNTEAPYEWDKILPRYEGHNYTTEQADAIARVDGCLIVEGVGHSAHVPDFAVLHDFATIGLDSMTAVHHSQIIQYGTMPKIQRDHAPVIGVTAKLDGFINLTRIALVAAQV